MKPLEMNAEQLQLWLRQEASWRLIGFMGEELWISLLENAGYTVVKQKPYFIQLPTGLADLGSKVDLQAIDDKGNVILIEVKSTSRDYEPQLSKAQANLMTICAKLKPPIPYVVGRVQFKPDKVIIKNIGELIENE